ncbi:hypothetical protein BKA70DRAFT_838462 [Coprinopsis sp. MPI-PUGE-AT-0042]|nr:hypothetical protein BKA70DRAFT_838462 [Coprinopsis sp. MPI-PUGE-AT-0042]
MDRGRMERFRICRASSRSIRVKWVLGMPSAPRTIFLFVLKLSYPGVYSTPTARHICHQTHSERQRTASLPFATATTANRHFTKPSLCQPHPGEREIARDGATLGEAVLIRADYNNLQVPQANLMTLRLMFNLITSRPLHRRTSSRLPLLFNTTPHLVPSDRMNPDWSFLCFQVEDPPDVKLDFLEKLHTRQFPSTHQSYHRS